jgi:hypothetical protein
MFNMIRLNHMSAHNAALTSRIDAARSFVNKPMSNPPDAAFILTNFPACLHDGCGCRNILLQDYVRSFSPCGSHYRDASNIRRKKPPVEKPEWPMMMSCRTSSEGWQGNGCRKGISSSGWKYGSYVSIV